jgi:hypothetical protein
MDEEHIDLNIFDKLTVFEHILPESKVAPSLDIQYLFSFLSGPTCLPKYSYFPLVKKNKQTIVYKMLILFDCSLFIGFHELFNIFNISRIYFSARGCLDYFV